MQAKTGLDSACLFVWIMSLCNGGAELCTYCVRFWALTPSHYVRKKFPSSLVKVYSKKKKGIASELLQVTPNLRARVCQPENTQFNFQQGLDAVTFIHPPLQTWHKSSLRRNQTWHRGARKHVGSQLVRRLKGERLVTWAHLRSVRVCLWALWVKRPTRFTEEE